MKRPEISVPTFRDTKIINEKVLAVTSIAIGVLFVALLAKYGYDYATEKKQELQLLNQELEEALKKNDAGVDITKNSASKIASDFVERFITFAKDTDVKWGRPELKVIQLLPEMLRRDGPYEG